MFYLEIVLSVGVQDGRQDVGAIDGSQVVLGDDGGHALESFDVAGIDLQVGDGLTLEAQVRFLSRPFFGHKILKQVSSRQVDQMIFDKTPTKQLHVTFEISC
jgi:hypothetical protein